MIVPGSADFSCLVGLTDLFDAHGLARYGLRDSFDFDQQNRATVPRKSRMNIVFNRAQCPAIQHFACRRCNRARRQVGDRLGRVVHGFEDREKSLHCLGLF